MSWAARITRSPEGGLRLRFSEPMKQLDMDADVARRLGSLLLVAAEEATATAPLDVVPNSRRGGRDGK